MPTSTILGADIGSVFVALVAMDRNRKVVRWEYRAYEGKVAQTLEEIMSEWTVTPSGGEVRIVAATSSSPRILKSTYRADWITANVAAHVSTLLEREATVHEPAPAYGAFGAALSALEERVAESDSPIELTDLVRTDVGERTYYYEPLTKPTGYPNFTNHERMVMSPELVGGPEVEVDRYLPAGSGPAPERFFLGVDIGSTSTKTVLVDPEGTVHWAFYTRTAGKPLDAIRSIFEVMHETGAVTAEIAGAGCTGSGRKFVGGVIGADLVLDEITAHARAATELDPDTDTIIEICGEQVAYGFLCGRDYATPSFVSANKSGFDLMAVRKKQERLVARAPRTFRAKRRTDKVVGIPTGLHLAEDRPFWERVFAELGIPTTTTVGYTDAVRGGTRRTSSSLPASPREHQTSIPYSSPASCVHPMLFALMLSSASWIRTWRLLRIWRKPLATRPSCCRPGTR